MKQIKIIFSFVAIICLVQLLGATWLGLLPLMVSAKSTITVYLAFPVAVVLSALFYYPCYKAVQTITKEIKKQ